MSRLRTFTLLLAGVSIVLLLSCGLGAAAVQGGAVMPPAIKLEFGGVRVVSNISTLPDCARLLAPGCLSTQPSSVVWIYTLWLLWQRNPGTQESPYVVQLFSTQIKR